MTNLLLNNTQLNADPDPDPTSFVWTWLTNLIGTSAATAVQTIFMIAVYGLVVYIIIIQVIRLIQNISNRNVEDGKARAEAKENIKGAVFVIAATAIIGGFGFTALCFFMNQWIKPTKFPTPT